MMGSATTAAITRRPSLPVEVVGLAAVLRDDAPEPEEAGAVAPEPLVAVSEPGRWSASGWAIVRGGRQGASVATPQLGGSQAGMRLAFALDDRGRFAVAARVASALAVRQQEAAVGIEWKPTRLPLRLVAERRIGVANLGGGPAFGAVGGVSALPVAAGFLLDGYGQAGAIARDGMQGYADGAVRLTRRLFRTTAGVTLELGLGAWGAAQRGAERLDMGPAAAAVLPVGATRVRVALEWRQRLVGAARPASGPALSIGADL